MLISDLCDYSDAFIAVKGLISGTCTNNANTRNKKLTFKNNALTNINNIFIGYAEDLNMLCQSTIQLNIMTIMPIIL